MNNQDNDLARELFGEPISTYTRAEAISDGTLIDVSADARALGIHYPVALTRAVWADCGDWQAEDSRRQTYQDIAGRLHDVLWMFRCAARHASGERIRFSLYRVPRGGRATRPRLTILAAVIGPGDLGEPVLTIMLPDED